MFSSQNRFLYTNQSSGNLHHETYKTHAPTIWNVKIAPFCNVLTIKNVVKYYETYDAAASNCLCNLWLSLQLRTKTPMSTFREPHTEIMANNWRVYVVCVASFVQHLCGTHRIFSMAKNRRRKNRIVSTC